MVSQSMYGCTDIENGSSMIEGNNKNKRGLASDRSIKKPRHSDMDFPFNTSNYSSVSEWASIPQEIFILILDRVYERIDYIRLAAVCKHWKNVLKEHTQRWCKGLPMLMIPFLNSRTKRTVYTISEGKIYTNVQSTVPYVERCSGSSHGWLATADEYFAITLLNPFTNALAIHLPPLTFSPPCYPGTQKKQMELKKNYEYFVHKVILSADPSLNPDNYMVVAIYDLRYRLAFIKAGQRDWTYITETWMFCDAIFHRGQIYAVGQGGQSFRGANQIPFYFTNDIRNGGMGLFKLEDESVTGLCPLLNPTPRAIWILPPSKDIP